MSDEAKPVFDVEKYIRELKWISATDYEKSLVAGNLRGLAHLMEVGFQQERAQLVAVAKAAKEFTEKATYGEVLYTRTEIRIPTGLFHKLKKTISALDPDVLEDEAK